MMFIMRRWLVRIMVCLLLGAATTVAVAWGFVLVLNTDPDIGQRTSHERWDEVTLMYTPYDPVRMKVYFEHNGWSSENAGARYELVRSHSKPILFPHPYPDDVGGYDVRTWRAGLPLAALQGHWLARYDAAVDWRGKQEGLIVLKRSDRAPLRGRTLPVGIIPSGFGINTLIYSVVWFALFFGLSTGRRAIRRRRGRCIRCAYDLRGDLERGCSECGWNREDAAA